MTSFLPSQKAGPDAGKWHVLCLTTRKASILRDISVFALPIAHLFSVTF